MQQIGCRQRVVEGAMTGLMVEPQTTRQGAQTAVGNFIAHQATGECDGIDGRVGELGALRARQRSIEKADVEANVVANYDRVTAELEQRDEDTLDTRCLHDHCVGDAGEHGDGGGYRPPGIHQRLECAEADTTTHFDRTDLGDEVIVAVAAGGLEVDDTECDIRKWNTEVIERTLHPVELTTNKRSLSSTDGRRAALYAARVTAEIDDLANEPGGATDVARLPASALRTALEFAVAIAAAGQKVRPPLVFPAGLKPFLKFQRLDNTALVQVRRVVAADEDFRSRIAIAATPELVDDLGLQWLHREDGWEQRVVELHQAAKADAQTAEAETALRKSERRRQAAEQAAVRTQAELLSYRDDIGREQVRREKAESKASAATRDTESLRRENMQMQQELKNVRLRMTAETERADSSTANLKMAIDQVRELEVVRDAVLSQRAFELEALRAEPVQIASMNPAAVQALEQAAAATGELSKALGRAAQALAIDGEPSNQQGVTPQVAIAQPAKANHRAPKRKPIAIPGGVYGDTLAATVHLLRTPAVRVLVDGYNVAKLAWPKLDLAHQRESGINVCEDIARRFGTDICIVFDGADIVGASAGRRLVRVRYSQAGVSADDVIRAEVAAISVKTPIVVVTNDQAIAVDVRNAGANVVASEALLAAAGRIARG